MIKPNIVFLDIDGVLNYSGQIKFEAGDLVMYKSGKLSSRCVNCLNSITTESYAKIVISSSWRKDSQISWVYDSLRSAGVTGEIIGCTPDNRDMHSLRGNEILQWCKEHEELVGKYYDYHNYVILDDDSDMLYWQKEHYFNCDNSVGLTPNMSYKINRFFKSRNNRTVMGD